MRARSPNSQASVGEHSRGVSMARFNAPRKFSRQILMPAAVIFLVAATQAALAKNGSHSDDHGAMHSDKHKDKVERSAPDRRKGFGKHKDTGEDPDSTQENQKRGQIKCTQKHKDNTMTETSTRKSTKTRARSTRRRRRTRINTKLPAQPPATTLLLPAPTARTRSTRSPARRRSRQVRAAPRELLRR